MASQYTESITEYAVIPAVGSWNGLIPLWTTSRTAAVLSMRHLAQTTGKEYVVQERVTETTRTYTEADRAVGVTGVTP